MPRQRTNPHLFQTYAWQIIQPAPRFELQNDAKRGDLTFNPLVISAYPRFKQMRNGNARRERHQGEAAHETKFVRVSLHFLTEARVYGRKSSRVCLRDGVHLDAHLETRALGKLVIRLLGS